MTDEKLKYWTNKDLDILEKRVEELEKNVHKLEKLDIHHENNELLHAKEIRNLESVLKEFIHHQYVNYINAFDELWNDEECLKDQVIFNWYQGLLEKLGGDSKPLEQSDDDLSYDENLRAEITEVARKSMMHTSGEDLQYFYTDLEDYFKDKIVLSRDYIRELVQVLMDIADERTSFQNMVVYARKNYKILKEKLRCIPMSEEKSNNDTDFVVVNDDLRFFVSIKFAVINYRERGKRPFYNGKPTRGFREYLQEHDPELAKGAERREKK